MTKMSQSRNKVYQNYFGSKNGSGVYQQIINQIRPHDVYMELFAGSGAIAQFKKPALKTYINDKSEKVVSDWYRSGIDIPDCVISESDAVQFLKEVSFDRDLKYVIYLDPPYPMDSRRSTREVYQYEMTDQQHSDLLGDVLQISAIYDNVDFIISTYQNPIYEQFLKGWNLHTFRAQTRKGLATEYLYMNYFNEAGILHQYDYLGNDYIDRQRIKRKIEKKVIQLQQLPATERQAIIAALSDIA
jgi:DNA adenine methylase